jgi:pyridoxal phosphate enzyme (YggS family)
MLIQMKIVERFNLIRAEIPAHIKIVAVSKTKPVDLISEIFLHTGHTLFGENKAQELSGKHMLLPPEINWHFIGHLQTNKIKLIAPYVGMIQSVDSFRLLNEINKEAKKSNRIIPCLIQFHIAMEEAKFGFSFDEAQRMFEEHPVNEMSNIKIKGVMGMATFTQDYAQVRSEFRLLRSFFDQLKSTYFCSAAEFNEISMGMSDDYNIAIDEGSTMVRIGSGIFGDR